MGERSRSKLALSNYQNERKEGETPYMSRGGGGSTGLESKPRYHSDYAVTPR